MRAASERRQTHRHGRFTPTRRAAVEDERRDAEQPVAGAFATVAIAEEFPLVRIAARVADVREPALYRATAGVRASRTRQESVFGIATEANRGAFVGVEIIESFVV